MKKILLTLFSLAIFPGLFAQSFSLLDTNGVVIDNGATVQVLGDPTDAVIIAKFHVKNDATEEKDVKVKKVINAGDTLPTTKNSICWGIQCYPPDVYETPFPLTIQPGELNTSFFGEYQPMTVPGVSRIMYVFFDSNNRDDSVAVTVEYNASPSSIGDGLISGAKFSDAYPNPARSIVKVDYSIPAQVSDASIVVTNMLGSEVKKIELNELKGTARIEVTELLNGIYFYSLVANDKLILTRKFVVKH